MWMGGLKMVDGQSRLVMESEFVWEKEEMERTERAIVVWRGHMSVWPAGYYVRPGLSTHQVRLLSFWAGVRLYLPTFFLEFPFFFYLLHSFPSPYQHLFSSNLLILFSTDGKSNPIIGAEHSTRLSKRSCCFQLANNGFSFEPLLVFFV